MVNDAVSFWDYVASVINEWCGALELDTENMNFRLSATVCGTKPTCIGLVYNPVLRYKWPPNKKMVARCYFNSVCGMYQDCLARKCASHKLSVWNMTDTLKLKSIWTVCALQSSKVYLVSGLLPIMREKKEYLTHTFWTPKIIKFIGTSVPSFGVISFYAGFKIPFVLRSVFSLGCRSSAWYL